jgi:formyl-CoA transferase
MYALNGIRILDFSRVLAGPFCTMLLADFGADVIKVERPGLGDDTREWGPPFAGDSHMIAYFISVNRNKRSLTLNLKSDEGQRIARQLALQSDVLIENFKVGQMKSYGLDYDSLRAEHPGLVYCSITGYGQDGPYTARPGYDYVIQGQSGLMSITGPEDGGPYKVGVATADVLTGLFASNAIQIALRHRDQTGTGQYIDVTLLESQIAALVNVVSNFLISQDTPKRYGNAHPNIVPYQTFLAADDWFILNVGNDSQYRAFCNAIDKPELLDDPRFTTNPLRVQNRAALIPILEAVFHEKTAAEWLDLFHEAGVPASPINDIPAVIDDPQVIARGLVQSALLHNGTSIDLLAPVPKMSETPGTIQRPPPALGQHSDEILRHLLGFDAEAIASLREGGVL